MMLKQLKRMGLLVLTCTVSLFTILMCYCKAGLAS